MVRLVYFGDMMPLNKPLPDLIDLLHAGAPARAAAVKDTLDQILRDSKPLLPRLPVSDTQADYDQERQEGWTVR